MDLKELKIRLKIPENDTSKDQYLEVLLEDAIDYVKTYCNQSFDDGFPSGVKQAITKLVKAYQKDSSVASESLKDMSKSYFEGGMLNEVHRLLKPYRRVRFI